MTREEITSGLLALATQFNPVSEESELILGAVEALEQEPCEDAISRQAVRNVLPRQKFIGYEAYLSCIAEIDKLPPVIPIRKEGRWTNGDPICPCCGEDNEETYTWKRELIRNEKGGCIGAKMICPKCNKDNKHDEYMAYCPNCGAKMFEPQESGE